MRTTCFPGRSWAVGLILLIPGCQQADQVLPFEVVGGSGVTVTMGSNGGMVSVPPSFSLAIPSGALTGSVPVAVARRTTSPFPGDAGAPVPASAFNVGPVGTRLAVPATVEIRVPSELLDSTTALRLSVAVLRQDGTVASFGGMYDATNGILRAQIDELGPVAAIVADDAIALGIDVPSLLAGGTFPRPAPPVPAGPATAPPGAVEFVAECSPAARQCFSSGLVRLWADQALRERFGDKLFLLNPSVSVLLDFLSFDASGVPTEIVGSISVSGELRARFNRAVSSFSLNDGATTGPTTNPLVTPLQVAGNLMIVQATTTADGTVEINEEIRFAIAGIGTTEMLTIQVEAEIDFENADGSITTGTVIAHLRLRLPEA